MKSTTSSNVQLSKNLLCCPLERSCKEFGNLLAISIWIPSIWYTPGLFQRIKLVKRVTLVLSWIDFNSSELKTVVLLFWCWWYNRIEVNSGGSDSKLPSPSEVRALMVQNFCYVFQINIFHVFLHNLIAKLLSVYKIELSPQHFTFERSSYLLLWWELCFSFSPSSIDLVRCLYSFMYPNFEIKCDISY